MRLCIVPCGSLKIWHRNPDAGTTRAKEAYIGSFAKTCIAYAERFHPRRYVILSAKYGFLFPYELIPGDYNVIFNDPSTNPISVEELRRQAEEKGLMKYGEIMVVAGSNYVNIARKVFSGKRIIAPLMGLGGMGSMVSAMKRATLEGGSWMNVFYEHGEIVTQCKICSKNNVIAQNNPPTPKIAAEDRNLAFKCNWMDTDYEKPCGGAGRKWNIYKRKSIWCTQPENPCYEFEKGLREDLPEFPCYESRIFKKSEFGAGVNHTGPKKGEGRKIKFITPGKLAIFTTVEPEKPESERRIFGFFVIKGHTTLAMKELQ